MSAGGQAPTPILSRAREREQLGAVIVELTPGKLRAWVEAAQPGARLCYARGYTLATAMPRVDQATRDAMHRLSEIGYLHLTQLRAAQGLGFLYLMQRSSRRLNLIEVRA